MTGEELLNWMQESGAQAWRDPSGRWTVFVRVGTEAIQPTKATLRLALKAAALDYFKLAKEPD